jgi:hypothetical protein
MLIYRSVKMSGTFLTDRYVRGSTGMKVEVDESQNIMSLNRLLQRTPGRRRSMSLIAQISLLFLHFGLMHERTLIDKMKYRIGCKKRWLKPGLLELTMRFAVSCFVNSTHEFPGPEKQLVPMTDMTTSGLMKKIGPPTCVVAVACCIGTKFAGLVNTIFSRIRRHVMNVNSADLLAAWNDKDKRHLNACMTLIESFMGHSTFSLLILS